MLILYLEAPRPSARVGPRHGRSLRWFQRVDEITDFRRHPFTLARLVPVQLIEQMRAVHHEQRTNVADLTSVEFEGELRPFRSNDEFAERHRRGRPRTICEHNFVACEDDLAVRVVDVLHDPVSLAACASNARIGSSG